MIVFVYLFLTQKLKGIFKIKLCPSTSITGCSNTKCDNNSNMLIQKYKKKKNKLKRKKMQKLRVIYSLKVLMMQTLHFQTFKFF